MSKSIEAKDMSIKMNHGNHNLYEIICTKFVFCLNICTLFDNLQLYNNIRQIIEALTKPITN